jgi:membrane associated rhomboid family serine protease
MFLALPLRDEPRPPGRPWATYAICAVNLAVYLLITLPLSQWGVDPKDPAAREYLHFMVDHYGANAAELWRSTSAYDLVVFRYGFRASAPHLWSLLTYMFLHSGVWHLGGNLLFLWVAGANVEHRLGRVGFVLAYLGLGVMACLGYALWSAGAPAPMIGASGAIFGVLGCYFLWFPDNRVMLLVVIVWLVRLVPFPARWVLGVYVVVSDVLPMLFDAASPVAHAAHVSGFAAGLALAYGLSTWQLRRPGRGSARSGSWSAADESSPEALARALAQDSVSSALHEYSLMSEPARARLDAAVVFALCDGLYREGRYDAALAVLQRFIAAHPLSAALPQAHLRAGMIFLQGLGRPAAAYQHALAVLDLSPSEEEARLARAMLAQIRASRLPPMFR